ncbi:MAG: bifunctional proline dehydrogenase/L-glutamate gamma-semialdehyde dehydrogenase PutA [Alphaproteobacteria bacterium]|nr:bifunctional proline dehydrogenase/L-glutamate gamma-semialdehyde dehydrogenase PutA [Alphaproteobacteria bacterium]
MKQKIKGKGIKIEKTDTSVFDSLESLFHASRFINDFYRANESQVVEQLLAEAKLSLEQTEGISKRAKQLVEGVRGQKLENFSIENFLQTYALNSQEGLILMCLAEALLRVPDAETKTRLIRDKIGSVSWKNSSSSKNVNEDTLFSKLTNFGLATADHLLHWGLDSKGYLNIFKNLTRRVSEPIIRKAITHAMKILGHQFVMGETIEDALKRAKSLENDGYLHSYDMLGEEARTKADAQRYYISYVKAIEEIGKTVKSSKTLVQPGISVKLSALHPRYELAQSYRIQQELTPLVLKLAILAKKNGIGLTIDAEESERLDLSLNIVEYISGHEELKGWNGFGLAVQAYQKRASCLIDYLIDMARRHKRKLCIRLVKGAYWDSEIKRTQERGLKDYSVFTRKVFTDISYQVCAQKMLNAPDAVYAQFATHNARTVATILELAGSANEFEFQRLHGMGEPLYNQVLKGEKSKIFCRVYAPVGEYRDLLAYLVRRLLENGANTSFVHKIYDPSVPIETLVEDPIASAQTFKIIPHPKIPLPSHLLGKSRKNSKGLDFNNLEEIQGLKKGIKDVISDMPHGALWNASPHIAGKNLKEGEPIKLLNPANKTQVVGHAWNGSAQDVEKAMASAEKAFGEWTERPIENRAQILERLGEFLEDHRDELISLLVYESGKTLLDAHSEVREAVDYCRYYALEARRIMTPQTLPGPTGEHNQLSLHGRGIFVCISPWNFPLAIFLGQISAALVTGNCVIAKSAHQTPLIAQRAILLAHQAGVPEDVLHFMPGKGSVVGSALLTDRRTGGVVFTGSTSTAQEIAKKLLMRPNAPIVPLIAETGGMNAMIVDSTALPEQVVQDIITSSFQSAGQRCSALRIVFIQEEIADSLLEMLKGSMEELNVGNPSFLSTDIGPVIDEEASKELQAYADGMTKTSKLICCVSLNKDHKQGNFIAPQAWELSSFDQMKKEVFGPILHVVRFKGAELDKVIDQINATGYGLTLGVHSRIDDTIQHIRKKARVGNLYVNRSMIGAVVGVQPFGGEGLSGTGPKAGGPHYLERFTVERTFTQNTTAAGGNATLLAELD